MPHVTDYYNLSGPVPFLDVDVQIDKPMFVDPRAIRLQNAPEPFVSDANHCTTTFFEQITECALNRRKAAVAAHGLNLLQRFREPWETRLGLAGRGFHGHGGAKDVGSWIWNTLTTDAEALLRVGILNQIEDLPLFVEGVDRDITSDLTTRIIFEPLAHFTASMLEQYPEFSSGSHRVKSFTKQVWDPIKYEWVDREFELPVAAGKALLLIPRDWARHTLLMRAGRFYDTSVLTFAQLEQAVFSESGQLLKTPKDKLKTQTSLSRGRSTNLRVTERALERDENLLAIHKAFVDSKYAPLNDNEVLRKLA